jgi:hypothetical protein
MVRLVEIIDRGGPDWVAAADELAKRWPKLWAPGPGSGWLERISNPRRLEE